MLTSGIRWITQNYGTSLMRYNLLYEEMCISSMLCQLLRDVLHSYFGQTPLQYAGLLGAHVYRQFTGEYR